MARRHIENAHDVYDDEAALQAGLWQLAAPWLVGYALLALAWHVGGELSPWQGSPGKHVLGLKVTDSEMGTIDLTLGNGARVFVYPKPNHEPASFTVLNFDVDDIDKAVDDLISRTATTKIYTVSK